MYNTLAWGRTLLPRFFDLALPAASHRIWNRVKLQPKKSSSVNPRTIWQWLYERGSGGSGASVGEWSLTSEIIKSLKSFKILKILKFINLLNCVSCVNAINNIIIIESLSLEKHD